MSAADVFLNWVAPALGCLLANIMFVTPLVVRPRALGCRRIAEDGRDSGGSGSGLALQLGPLGR